jgi:DNA-binding Xre family transcriptional regulator
MQMLRLRVTELMGDMTPYALSKASGKRISMSTAYRLIESNGKLKTYSAAMIEALLDIFDVEPGALIERVPEKRGKK